MTNMTRLGQKEKKYNFQFDRYLPHAITVCQLRHRQAGTWHHEKPRTYYSGTAEEHAASWLPEVAFQPPVRERMHVSQVCEGSAATCLGRDIFNCTIPVGGEETAFLHTLAKANMLFGAAHVFLVFLSASKVLVGPCGCGSCR